MLALRATFPPASTWESLMFAWTVSVTVLDAAETPTNTVPPMLPDPNASTAAPAADRIVTFSVAFRSMSLWLAWPLVTLLGVSPELSIRASV